MGSTSRIQIYLIQRSSRKNTLTLKGNVLKKRGEKQEQFSYSMIVRRKGHGWFANEPQAFIKQFCMEIFTILLILIKSSLFV